MLRKFKTDAGEFTLRRYEKKDEKNVLELWRAAFNNEMSLAMWRWKYIDNPYMENLLLCESEKGEILVLYGGIPYKAHRQGKSVIIVQLMDIMSHPDVRGKGLFVRSGQAFFDFFCEKGDAELLYGFPGAFHFDLGRRILEYFPLAAKVAYLKVNTEKLAAPKKFSLNRLEKIEKPGDEFNRLWLRCRKDYPYSVVRDFEFIKWRFFSHPEKKYELWCLKGKISGKIKGYAVISISNGTACLVDMLCRNSAKEIKIIFSELGTMLKLRGILYIHTWLPGTHFLKNAAILAGFENYGEPLGIIATVRRFDHSPDLSWIDENLFYTMADADIF